VALRCALLRGRLGRCYAGCGIVRDSEPAAELAETEVKLAALLPLLAG
jgi:isochorismate synthase EntC